MDASQRGRQVAVVLLVLSTVFSMVGTVGVAAPTPPEEEPNDGQEAANEIAVGETVTGEIAGDEDEDWFAVDVEAGETINVTATVDGAPTKMNVVDPDGNQEAKTRGSNETIWTGTTATRSGTYYVRLFKWFGDGGADYSFEVRTFETTDREPNEARESATRISTGETISDEMPIGDVDWYAFDAEAGETINLSAEVSGSAGIEFTIVNPNGNAVDGSQGSNTALLTGTTASQTGTYHVRIFKTGGTVGATYSFTVRTYGTTDNEPNEDMANATRLSLNASVEDTLSQGDVDWYAFELEAGDSINVSGTVEGAGGIDFKLLHRNGSNIGGTGNVGGGQYSFNATAPSTGVYYVVVKQSSAPGPDYTLNVHTDGDTTDEQQGTDPPGDPSDGDEEDEADDGDEGGGLPILLIALVLGLAVVLLAVFLWRRDGD